MKTAWNRRFYEWPRRLVRRIEELIAKPGALLVGCSLRKQSVADENLAVRQEHRFARGARMQELSDFSPCRRGIRELDLFDRGRECTGPPFATREHEPPV